MQKSSLTVLVLALPLVVLGCGDTTTGGEDMAANVVIPHNFDQINKEILQPSCAGFSVCHSTAGQKDAGKLNLEVDPYNALVGAMSDNAKAKGEGLLRVKPCDAAKSFLHVKLVLPNNTDPKTDYGNYMPDTNPHLPAEQIKAIDDWINRGALLNEPATVTGSACTLFKDMGATD
jgi:hypothetical protein